MPLLPVMQSNQEGIGRSITWADPGCKQIPGGWRISVVVPGIRRARQAAAVSLAATVRWESANAVWWANTVGGSHNHAR